MIFVTKYDKLSNRGFYLKWKAIPPVKATLTANSDPICFENKTPSFPPPVFIEYKNEPICQGVIVSNKLILTTTSCVKKGLGTIETFTITNNNEKVAAEPKILRVHDHYTNSQWEIVTDSAIVELETPLNETTSFAIATLPQEKEQFEVGTVKSAWNAGNGAPIFCPRLDNATSKPVWILCGMRTENGVLEMKKLTDWIQFVKTLTRNSGTLLMASCNTITSKVRLDAIRKTNMENAMRKLLIKMENLRAEMLRIVDEYGKNKYEDCSCLE